VCGILNLGILGCMGALREPRGLNSNTNLHKPRWHKSQCCGEEFVFMHCA